MTSLIIYPAIIIVAASLLVIIFLRALQTSEDREKEAQIQGHVPVPEKKESPVEALYSRLQEKAAFFASKLKRKAHKQQIKAALEEAQIEKKEKDAEEAEKEEKQTHIPEAADVDAGYAETVSVQKETPEQERGQKLSRMGEIILSYHKSADGSGGEGFHDEKEISLVQAVEEDPKSASAYENLGDYYMERQRFDDARECYKYVLRVDPRHKKAQDAMRKLDRVLGVG